MSQLRHHGLKIIDSTHAELRIGIVRLIEQRQSWLWIGENNLSEDQHAILKRFNNRGYWQCCSKIRDTCFKMIYALNRLGSAILVMENCDTYAFDGAPIDHAAIYYSAIDEAPYHLDAYISYLRIFADCISFALPFFYVTTGSISNNSFRDQKKWFLEKMPTFDPEYSGILKTQTKWFDLLAGNEDSTGGQKGIRDLNYHRFATYQFGSRPLPNGHHQILISHVTAQGIQQPDLLATLEELTHDYFQFLELVHAHFAKLASEEFPQHPWSSEERSILVNLEMEAVSEKYRLFPTID